MNKTMKSLALLFALMLMLTCASAASAALKPFEGGMERITYSIPNYIKLAKDPFFSTTPNGMKVFNIIIDAEKTDWNTAAMNVTNEVGHINHVFATLSAPDSSVKKTYSVNTGYKNGDEETTLERLEEVLADDGYTNDSTSVGNSCVFATYSSGNGFVSTYINNQGWGVNYPATVVQWLDANGNPVGDTEVFLVNIVCDTEIGKSVSIPRVSAERLYGAAYADGPETGLYPESVAKMDKKNGVVSFTIPNTGALRNNQVLAAVATPDGTDNWDFSYSYPGQDYKNTGSLMPTDVFTGSEQAFALLNLPINDPNGLNSASYIVNFTKKGGSQSETTRLDLTAVCGESKPWLYYTGWTPASSCALPWNNTDYDFGFTNKLKMNGWYHFEMKDASKKPTGEVMEDPDIYRPVIFGPSGASYYKATGSSIMTNAFFSDANRIRTHMSEIEKDFETEDFSEVEGPMRGASFPGVVWPMDPKDLEMDGQKTTVYLPSFYAGEDTINYFVFRWYDENHEPIQTSFFLCTTDTFFDLNYSKVEAVLPLDEREYPVLITNHGPTQECTLVVETYPQASQEYAVYYELYLVDKNGQKVSNPGKTRMELLLPYPDGYTEEELYELEFAVTHYNEYNGMYHTVKETFNKNTITYTKNGILIEIFDLSPFLFTWKKAQSESVFEVPVTGENTVKVKAELNGDTVEVLPFDEDALGSAIGDEQGVALTINLSILDDDVTTAEFPSELIDMFADAANDPENGMDSVTVAMPCDVSLNLDAATLTQMAKLADGDEAITLDITPTKPASLSSEQNETIGDRPAYHISIAVGGKSVSKLNGTATLSAPYALRAGEQAEGIIVNYVDDQGGTQPCDTEYDSHRKLAIWQTNHFSVYMIDHVKTAHLPQTGDHSNIFLYVLLCSMSLAALMVLYRKRSNA